MAEFCMVASHNYSPGFTFNSDQFLTKLSKEHQPYLPGLRLRQDTVKSCSLSSESYQIEEPWKPIGGFPDGTEFIKIDQAIKRHVLNGSDTNPNLILLSFGVARQILKHEKILKFLMSGSSVLERGELDPSVLSDLYGLELEELSLDVPREQLLLDREWSSSDSESETSLIFPSNEICFDKDVLDITKNKGYESGLTCETDGLGFTGQGTDMKDILSIIADHYPSNFSTNWDKHAMVVPYFTRRKSSATKALNLEAAKVDLAKSMEKTKAKQCLKKKTNKKTDREREMYTHNYVLACESLLSIMFDKKRDDKTAILSLKKSGPELSQLLTQFSASIAGTGIAVLFCVVCKLACSRAPLCGTKLLSTGLGIGLVWFSWSVNKLRDAILCISKRSSKCDNGDVDTMKILDRSVNEIYFRAATLFALVVLRVA